MAKYSPEEILQMLWIDIINEKRVSDIIRRYYVLSITDVEKDDNGHIIKTVVDESAINESEIDEMCVTYSPIKGAVYQLENGKVVSRSKDSVAGTHDCDEKKVQKFYSFKNGIGTFLKDKLSLTETQANLLNIMNQYHIGDALRIAVALELIEQDVADAFVTAYMKPTNPEEDKKDFGILSALKATTKPSEEQEGTNP